MGRICTICAHPERQRIDEALMLHAGSYAKIAQTFGVGYWAVYRHEHEHLRSSVARSKELNNMLSADNLLERLSALDNRTLKLLNAAEQSGDLRTALAAVRESRSNIDSFARIAVGIDKIVDADADAVLDTPDVTIPEYSPDELREMGRALAESGLLTAPLLNTTPQEHDVGEERTEAAS